MSYRIPFNADGDQLHYPEESYYRPLVWADNCEFEGELRFKTLRRGRSAAYFVFETHDAKERIMFLADFAEAMQESVIACGVLKGRFTYVKRGQNYGIKRLGGTNEDR